MAVPEVDRPSVDELAAEFLERHREGKSPSIDEYVRRCPDLADEIRELFPTIIKLEGLKHHISGSSSGHAGVGLPGISRLGDFRIVREVARGGMGVVYEAEQESLHRRVALKVLGANIASSPKLLARFRREAESAARLHHTNIVPVFGVGEEHGVFFYAMQYIEGAPLSSVISELRNLSEHRSMAQIVEQCCLAPPDVGEPSSRLETRADGSSVDVDPGPVHARVESAGSNGSPRVVVGSDPEQGTPEPVRPANFIDSREAARMAADLAGALHFAHLHGVLHRDVKPSNVLVDRDGAVWITDFGLAKHEESGDLTRSGDVIGTLRYMAPEQLHGQTDVRSDVYSLGLTLYEMLAGQPAFDDSLRAALIQRKTAQPPPPLRSLNQRIPRDLETIVQKACAPLPADRYQTALEFAEDLHRFIEERPIRARRLPVPTRIWRWMRRNPVVSSLGLLAAALLIAVGAAVLVGNYNTSIALDAAITQQKRAEANLDAAVAALQEITNDISSRGVPQSLLSLDEGEEAILQTTPVTAADAELLKKLLRFFDVFAASNETDLTAETAKIQVQIGEIRHRLGQLREAEDGYEQAIETYAALQADEPDNPEVTIAIAETWNRIGTVQAERGRVFSAMKSHNAARAAIETSPTAMAADGGQFALARTFTLYRQVYGRAGAADLYARSSAASERDSSDGQRRGNSSSDSRERNEERSADDRREELHEEPDNDRRERTRSSGDDRGSDRSGRRRSRDEQWTEIRESFPPESIERAIEIIEELVERNPDDDVYRLSLAQSYRVDMVHSYFVRLENGERKDTSQPAIRAIEILTGLTEEYPDDPQYLYELADMLCLSVRFQRDLPIEEETMRIDRARDICDHLTHAYPQVPSYQALAAVAERRMASIHRHNEKLAQAERLYESAADTYAQLTQQFPTVSLYPIAGAQTLSELADTLHEAGEYDRAYQESVDAVVLAESCQRLRHYDDSFRQFLRRLRSQRERLADSLPSYSGTPETGRDL